MIDWIKEHPILATALGLGAVVLFIILKNALSGGQATVVQQGSGSNDAAQLQQQQIQAGVDVATQQLGTQLAIAQLTAESTNRQTDAAVAISHDTNAANLAVAGIQGQVQIAQYQYALATQQDIDATSAQINSQNTNRDIAVNHDQVQGAIDIASIQGSTATTLNAQNNEAYVAALQAQLQQQEVLAQAATENVKSVTDLYARKGYGSGNLPNAIAAASFQPQGAAPGAAPVAGDSVGGIISSIGNLFTNATTGLIGKAAGLPS